MQPSKNSYQSNLAICQNCVKTLKVDSNCSAYSGHYNHSIKFIPTEISFIYDFLESLGSGTFGNVFRVQRKNDKSISAMKLIFDSYDTNELNILRKLKHKYIVNFIEVLESNGVLAIVMELANSSLDKRFKADKPLSEKSILNYFIQMCEGVQYIHENKIIHRDLKPNNILLQATNVKIADFGISKEAKHEGDITHSQQYLGSKKFSAPEFFDCKPYYDYSIDIYSLGKILEEMLKQSKIPIVDYKEIIGSHSFNLCYNL